MMKLDNLYDDCFILLSAALNHKRPYLSKHYDWQTIFEFSKKQAVLGLMLDSISLLPNDLRPPNDFYTKWCVLSAQIEYENSIVNDRIAKLFSFFQLHRIPAVLLKGQGIAPLYPNALHRQSGDIDVYVPLDYFSAVEQFLSIDGILIPTSISMKHTAYTWRNVTVELHRQMTIVCGWKAHKYFENKLSNWFPNNIVAIMLSGQKVMVPPLEFDALLLLSHIREHLLGHGIGLRQLIDWLLVMRKLRMVKYEKELLLKDLKALNLLPLAKSIIYLGVHYLGFESKDFMISPSKGDDLSTLMLKDLLVGGNFGHFNSETLDKPNGFLSGKLFSFVESLRRMCFWHKLVPHTLRSLFFFRIRNFAYSLMVSLKRR